MVVTAVEEIENVLIKGSQISLRRSRRGEEEKSMKEKKARGKILSEYSNGEEKSSALSTNVLYPH